jgi:hypothetical protein
MLQIYYLKMTADICLSISLQSGLQDIDDWIGEFAKPRSES